MLGVLNEWCRSIGISVGEKEAEKLLIYLKELLEWNERINLVAKAPEVEIFRKHFLDSLTLGPFIPVRTGVPKLRLIDIGSGAGFPGVVLKVIREDLSVLLLESSSKKCSFLRHIVSLLRLTDTAVHHGRAESFSRIPDWRGAFDIAVCRAVAHLSIISEYAFPFLSVGGCFLAQKGPSGDKELREAKKALDILGGMLENKTKLALPGGGETRLILVLKKVRETPEQYPRREGMPAKRPLHKMFHVEQVSGKP